MSEQSTIAAWPDAAEEFLSDLLAVQKDLLAALDQRRRPPAAAAAGDSPSAIVTSTVASSIEPSLLERLRQCHFRRADLLKAAARTGLPAQTLRGAVAALADSGTRRSLQALLDEAESAGRRVRLAGLTQWMLAQRSLAHVGQLLEILATGAPQPPTYGNGAISAPRGGLLDEAA